MTATLTIPDLLDPEALARLNAVGGATLVATVLDSFLREAPERIALLREALRTTDRRTLARIAHTMIPGLSYVGAEPAARVARRLEQVASNGTDQETIGESVERLDQLVSAAISHLRVARSAWPT